MPDTATKDNKHPRNDDIDMAKSPTKIEISMDLKRELTGRLSKTGRLTKTRIRGFKDLLRNFEEE